MAKRPARPLAPDFDPARYTCWVRARRAIGYCLWWLVAWVCCALFARWRRVGWRRLPAGPQILACTHFSHVDFAFACVSAGRKLDWATAADLFEHGLGRRIYTSFDTFPVQRGRLDVVGLRVARDRLARGRVVAICPEGGIRTGASSVLAGAELKLGAATLAQLTGLAIRPMVCLGTDQFYVRQAWFRRARVLIGLGEPLHARTDLPPREARVDLNQRLADALRALYAELAARPEVTSAMLPRTAQERWAELC
jgi:1-acyl-sn-glycerol-3-phosphate acyltransferase